MAKIGCSLARFMAKHHSVRIDEPESIDDHLAFHTLNWIDHNGHSSLGQRLETLLGVYIDAGQPASEARMRVIPSDDHFRSSGLLEHV